MEKPQLDNPFDAYNNTNGNGELRKISDELLNKYKGKVLELYIGDQYETLNFDDYSTPKNCSIFGTLIDVLDRFVIFDCYYMDQKTRELRSGNRIFINAFQIRAFTEVNGKGSLGDIFLSVDDAKEIRKLISKGQ